MAGTVHALNAAVKRANGNETPVREVHRDGENLISGDFRIDLDRRTVMVRDKRMDLTAEEFDLLVFLVANPKRLVTPQTTLSTQWSVNGLHQAKFLRVLLSLRKKLDETGAGLHYIRTEPFIVYRFDPLG